MTVASIFRYASLFLSVLTTMPASCCRRQDTFYLYREHPRYPQSQRPNHPLRHAPASASNGPKSFIKRYFHSAEEADGGPKYRCTSYPCPYSHFISPFKNSIHAINSSRHPATAISSGVVILMLSYSGLDKPLSQAVQPTGSRL